MKRTSCARAEDAVLVALGTLPPADCTAFCEHTLSCPRCRAGLEAWREAVARLDLELARADVRANCSGPRASLRTELMARIGKPRRDPRPWHRWSGPATGAFSDGATTVPDSPEGWEPTNVAGIEARPLSVDAKRRFVTMLVRMQPGTAYPPHRHAGREECYVVRGDLRIGDRQLVAGDYQVAEAGSVHGVQATEGGCTLLIVSSQDDELL